jgi:hypothetical protein
VAPAPSVSNALIVKVFSDSNSDGRLDPGEPGISTAVVEVVSPDGKITRVPVQPDGTIRLENIPAGTYTIRVVSTGVDGKPTTKVLGTVVVPAIGEAQIEFGYNVEVKSVDLAFTGFDSTRMALLGFGLVMIGSVLVRRRQAD